jgi:hypothetical protein
MDDQILTVQWQTGSLEASVVRIGRKSIQVIDRARVEGNFHCDDESETLRQQVLSALAQRMPIHSLDCLVLISAALFQFRLIALPFQKRQDIEQVLPFEIDATIVGGIESMALDFDVIGTTEKGSLILAACIPKRCIEKLLAELDPYRIRMVRIVPSAYALARGLFPRDEAQGQAWVLIDVESPREVSLVGGVNNTIRFVRHVYLDIPLVEHDLAGWRALGMEIRRTLLAERERADFSFRPDFGAFRSDRDAPGIAALECLTQAAHLPIQTLDAWIGAVDGASSAENALFPLRLQIQGARMAGGIDFRPQTRSIRTFWNNRRKRILWTAGLAGLAALCGVGYIGVDMALSARQAKALDQMISERFYQVVPREVPMVEPVQQLRTKIKELEDDPLLAFSGHPARTVDILDAFSRDVLANLDVVIARMSIDIDKLSVTGHASDYESVYEMKRRIEKRGGPASVTIQSATQEQNQNRVIFSMDISRFNP